MPLCFLMTNELIFSQSTIFLELILAALLGTFLGLEREYIGKIAGARTYALVSMGAALFTILSREEFKIYGNAFDPSRIPSQILVGIGFIGAGIIIHQGMQVKGITTAAGLWVVAGLGMAIGFGMYEVAAFVSVLAFVIMFFVGKLEIDSGLKDIDKVK